MANQNQNNQSGKQQQGGNFGTMDTRKSPNQNVSKGQGKVSPNQGGRQDVPSSGKVGK